MKTNEIFVSLQGEGVYQGLPTVFIRLAGCNLLPKCYWCDTAYAQLPSSGEEKTVGEVVKKVVELLPYQGSWVCVTGGEPLWQPDELEVLVRELKTQRYRVEIETNGSLPKPGWWTLVDSWCADIKCPSSGVAGVSREEWFETRPCDQVKFVCGNEEDLKFAERMIQEHLADSPVLLVSPVIATPSIGSPNFDVDCLDFDKVWVQKVVEFCLEHQVRFSLQWHKVVFGNKRGV